MNSYERQGDNCLIIGGNKIAFDEGIHIIVEFQSILAVMDGNGDILLINEKGDVKWQYDKKTITEIWKKDEDTLCMYDGQADIWVDVNKLEVIKMIWNPWGLDNPEENV